MLMESVMRLRSGVQGHLFRIPSVHFQVSAFVCIYTINDTTTETKTPLSRARANPRIGAAEPLKARAVRGSFGVDWEYGPGKRGIFGRNSCIRSGAFDKTKMAKA